MHRDHPTALNGGAAEAAGVLGATSFVGQAVITRLVESRQRASERVLTDSSIADGVAAAVFAFSRRASPAPAAGPGKPTAIHWHRLPVSPGRCPASIPHWITVCPLWTVPEHFPLLEAAGARRLVALSSTSRFTKRVSAAAADRAVAERLAAAEEAVLDWSRAHGIATTILRPTMIYDGVHDGNVARIVRFIRRFGFYPVAGSAEGLRQPIHADDVAAACQTALACDGLRDSYEISGGEKLPYREMVRRIFASLGRPTRLVRIPLPLVRASAPLGRVLPGLASLASMAVRMNEDLAFDHAAAARDFGFQPRAFSLPLRPDPNHAAGSLPSP